MGFLPLLNFMVPALFVPCFLWLFLEGLWKGELSLRDKILFPVFILVFVGIAYNSFDAFWVFLDI
jgi:hypothetical protein